MPGTLFVVATPIGNLEDVSFRALQTLRDVDLIAAEDTRRTSKLLAHYEIRRPLVSLREHNEIRETPRLVARLHGGESIALVSDAGTPGIADPGARLVRAARDAAIRVIPIPGPSAVSAALSASGFPADQFVFLGFPPPAGSARRTWLNSLQREPRTLVFFEAPHRIRRTLNECRLLLVNRQIIAFREISKIHEESVVYQNNDNITPKGEFVVTVSPDVGQSKRGQIDVPDKLVADIFGYITEHTLGGQDAALERTALAFDIDQKAVLKRVKKYKYSVKRPNAATP